MVETESPTDTEPPELTYTHTRLLVDDYATCLRFYRDTLGFEIAWGDEDSGYADLRTEGATIALFDATEMAAAVGADRPESGSSDWNQDDVALVFSVESVDDAYDRLQADVEFVTEPHDRSDWGIRVAHFRDPDGTLVEINEPLDGR